MLADGEREVGRRPKAEVAAAILDEVERFRTKAAAPTTVEPGSAGRREESSENAYDLFKKGSELLEQGDFMAASVPLERARKLEPDKGSIREALGRAYFRSRRFEQAARSSPRWSSATP